MPSPDDAPPRAATARVRAARAAVVGATAALVVLGLAWELWLAPTGRGTLALKVLPLLPFFPALLRHRMVAYRALSLLVWLYVLEGALRASTDSGVAQALAGVELALCAVVFAGCVVYIRTRLRNGAALAAG